MNSIIHKHNTQHPGHRAEHNKTQQIPKTYASNGYLTTTTATKQKKNNNIMKNPSKFKSHYKLTTIIIFFNLRQGSVQNKQKFILHICNVRRISRAACSV